MWYQEDWLISTLPHRYILTQEKLLSYLLFCQDRVMCTLSTFWTLPVCSYRFVRACHSLIDKAGIVYLLWRIRCIYSFMCLCDFAHSTTCCAYSLKLLYLSICINCQAHCAHGIARAFELLDVSLPVCIAHDRAHYLLILMKRVNMGLLCLAHSGTILEWFIP